MFLTISGHSETKKIFFDFLVREPRFHEKCETHAKIEDRGSVFRFLNLSGLGLQHIKSFQGKVDFEYEGT